MNTIRPDLLTSEGLDGISLVGLPAIERDFIAFEKEEKPVEVFLSSDEKRQIVGPILIPMQKIPRTTEEGVRYNLMFTDEDIQSVQHLTARKHYRHNVTLGHSVYTDNVYPLEMWIKESENDKSVDYGFGDLPVGTMFSKMQVSDEIIWDEVKNGSLNGFSIEMYTKLKDVEMSKEIEKEVETPEVSLASVLESINSLGEKFEQRLNEYAEGVDEKISTVTVEMSKLMPKETAPEVELEVEVKTEEPEAEEVKVEEVEVELEADTEAKEEINLEKELIEEQSGESSTEEEKKEPVMLSAREARKLFKEKFVR